ncbi:MAG: hypothetical protein PHX51_02965 [Clostridia bacterium]|nr:hypothetical protein [Clostridia bacterium]
MDFRIVELPPFEAVTFDIAYCPDCIVIGNKLTFAKSQAKAFMARKY